MKSTEIKQRCQINFLFIMFHLSVLQMNSMSKLIHNRSTCKLIIETLRPATYTCIQTNNCVFVFALIRYSLLLSSELNYTETIYCFPQAQ